MDGAPGFEDALELIEWGGGAANLEINGFASDLGAVSSIVRIPGELPLCSLQGHVRPAIGLPESKPR